MFSKTLLSAFALLSPVLALVETGTGTVPGAFIVEFVETDHSTGAFFSNLTRTSIAATPRLDLTHGNIFNGASFHLNDPSTGNIETIFNMAQVKNIWPVRLYARPQAAIPRTVTREEISAIISKRDGTNDTYPPHVQGNVDKLHAEGFTGKGVRIAVVDTGIDYKHPSLGGCFGPGCKVAFGRDLVGDAYTGANTPIPDDDPIDCDGHGTHVAGIIGANDAKFTGVAPEAELGIFKVFGCPTGGAGSAANDVLIAAFAAAYASNVDLITASIGGPSGWSEDPWAIAVSRIVDAGVPCTIAAGNEGAEGVFYASGAADATGAIAVGSVNNLNSPEVLTTATFTAGGANETFGYTPAVGDFGDISLPVVAVSPIDGCTPFTSPTGDLSGKLVLIQRGTCTFDTKVGNAIAQGAKYVMLYNNVPGTLKASVTLKGAVVGMVPPETGAEWAADIAAGKAVTAVFKSGAPLFITAVDNTLNGGYMSTFSTWGPTNELVARPHVSAPGGNILSTYLLKDGGYAVLSGTSMATPYIAGVAGLYLQNLKNTGAKADPYVLRNMLTSTGRPLNFNDGTATPYSYLAPVVQQGSGIVDAHAVVHNTAYVDIDLLSFNDTQNQHRDIAFRLYNNGNSPVTFNLKHNGAATAYTTAAGSTIPQAFPPDMLATYAGVTIEPNTVTIGAGRSKRIVVTVTPPSGLDAKRIPVYSGFINIASSSNSTTALNVPYVGVATSMKKQVVTDFESGYPFLEDPLTNATNPTTFTGGNAPIFNYRLVLGSANVLLNVVSVSDPKLNTLSAFEDKVYGAVSGFPATYQPRNAAGKVTSVQWDKTVTLANNVTVNAADGSYKFIYRALKVSGNPNSGRDYEKWESEVFTVKS